MHTLLIAVVVFLLLALLVVAPRRSRLSARTEELVKRLPPGRLEQIAYLYDPDQSVADARFWVASGGLAGVWDRLKALVIVMRVLQLAVEERPEIREDTNVVWVAAAQQLFFSLLALPEAILAHVFPSMNHFCAQIAAERHVALTHRANNLCFTEATPECIGNLYGLR